MVALIYAAFGYLALLGAILWGMLFFGGDVSFPNMDVAGSAAPLQAACVDLGILLLLALLHRSMRRGMLRQFLRRSIPPALERSTQAWAAAAVLASVYAGWQRLPQVLWAATGSLQWALSALFYLAWTLILMGAFLASHLAVFEIAEAGRAAAPAAGAASGQAQGAAQARATAQARASAEPQAAAQSPFLGMPFQPLYFGILAAVWATSVMTLGHLLLATAVTAYLLLDGLWAVRKSGSERRRALLAHSRASASRVSA